MVAKVGKPGKCPKCQKILGFPIDIPINKEGPDIWERSMPVVCECGLVLYLEKEDGEIRMRII